MKRRRPRSPSSSIGSGPVELPLPPAPWLTLLLALQACGLPIYLLLTPLRHSGAAAGGCLLLALFAAPSVLRLCLGKGPRAPRRLSFTPEGEFRLDLAGGFCETVVPTGRSLLWGPWWLLILQSARTRHYVVLECVRVDPARLAALGRALRRVAARPDGARPALRSLIRPGGPGV